MTYPQQICTLTGIPYLPSVEWYAAWFHSQICGDDYPLPTDRPNRALIRGAWGEQTLIVPIEGGRKRMAHTPYSQLRLSEHDDWRHSHWQAITSAYGALPYFHYLEHEFAPIYTNGPIATLRELCEQLHLAFLRSSGLDELILWIKRHSSESVCTQRSSACPVVPKHISAIELLFLRGPETVFTLLQ